MRAANKHPDYPDGFKTKRQWAREGFLPIDDNQGSREWTNVLKMPWQHYFVIKK